MQQVFKHYKIIRARKILKTLKNHCKGTEQMSQCTHVQNHAYTNKSRYTVCTQCAPNVEPCIYYSWE